jgi:competence protein ComEC
MIGFQLSYSAVIGIAVFMPWFQRVFFVGNYWWDMLAGGIGVSLAATLATFPLVWFHFGTFPTHFLVANILSSFLVTLIVFLGFIMVLLATVPGIGAFLGLCVGTLIDWLNILAHEITALPASIITRWSWQEPACQVLLLEVVGFMLMLSIPVLIRHLRNKSQTLEPVPQGIWG